MPIKQPENRIWAVYNHRPGGHVVAIHFEDIVRTKKVGENTQEIKFTAKEQLEAFKKSPQTALYVLDDKGQGKLVLNEVLVYAGDAIDWKDGAAADKVLAFAHKKGVRPIPTAESAKGDEPKGFEYNKRMEALEKRADAQDKKLEEILAAVTEKK